MDIFQLDVLIVGAGPAGSMAAREAAGQGANVLLIERKRTIGIPVQCAEYVPGSLGEFSNTLAESVVQKIKGIHTFIGQEHAAYTRAPGFIIDRKIFDRNLAYEARDAGVTLVTGARLVERSPVGVIVNYGGKGFQVAPRIIIGADGPRSLVAGWINDFKPPLAVAAQYTMELNRQLEDVEIYLDEAYPGGYAWLFPKGQVCNLGVAVDPKMGGNVTAALRNFVETISKTGKLRSTEPINKTAGFIPISGALPSTKKGNILLAGDAGGFTHPITGGGILHALITGRLAGKISARALKEGDLSLLEDYETAWKAILGETLARGVRKRNYLTAQCQNRGPKDFQTLARQTWIVFPEYYQNVC
ncbi:MAG: NAD(P)/FAD-dependent oxidoreductase [Thermoanaerobacteraceae bacterium]|nr:NAD(P)/FAD-dependent oxidoreductase [Thermoanaerobacteraceae bacterium]